MNYSQIRSMDISNGEGVGIALFVQGCHFHCPSCFNQDTWDFNGGKEWTEKTKETFLKLADKPYIKRVSFLGGECLSNENLEGVYDVIKDVKELFPDKKIWMYTGYTWESIFNPIVTDNLDLERDRLIELRQEVVKMTDILIDGQYIHEQRGMNLKFRGSKNQRVIDVKESLKQGKIILYLD
ncbi:MAG: anaerobic ribonucleoside-triphosphate reductase activating protein [Mediterraneibacter faecis]